jgi:hypothetical protein
MLAWVALIALVVLEAIAIRYWTMSQLYPFFFNDWAPLLYSVLLAVDIVIAWLVSMLYAPGGTPGMQLMVVLGVGLVIVVLLVTLFLRWVVRFDMTDISDKDKRK